MCPKSKCCANALHFPSQIIKNKSQKVGEKEKKDYNVHKGIRSGTVKKNSVVCSLTEVPMTWTQLAHFAGLAGFAKIMSCLLNGTNINFVIT